jgi:hypothetical protein
MKNPSAAPQDHDFPVHNPQTNKSPLSSQTTPLIRVYRDCPSNSIRIFQKKIVSPIRMPLKMAMIKARMARKVTLFGRELFNLFIWDCGVNGKGG